MTKPTVRLAFFKLNVPDMQAALDFYGNVFGFTVTQTFDEPEFIEHILSLPGQDAGPNLLLVCYKDGREVSVGSGHGPVGLMTDNAAALIDRALAAGAGLPVPLFDLDGVKVAILTAPEGHEIELVQLPAT